MPTVTLSLRSQRSKVVTDNVTWVEVRGRMSGPVNSSDIDLRFESGEVVLDVPPDRYSIQIEVPGFAVAKGTIEVGKNAVAQVFPLTSLVTRLPHVSELSKEQRRLLQTLDASKTPGAIWNSLSDNKCATFFQVTHALTQVRLPNTDPLSMAIDRIVRLGGAELAAPDKNGRVRTVIGWRMHVLFNGGASIEAALTASGFKRDAGEPHPTHKKFGFVRSYRERAGMPRLQMVVNHEGAGADVDLDHGAFHKSSPHDVYKSFKVRFADAAQLYKVD